MDLKSILHMAKGDGEFSYAQNANTYEIVLSNILTPILESAIKSVLIDEGNGQIKALNVADLGCGVGKTPIAVISTVTEIVHKICKDSKWDNEKVPEIQMYMSDLPSNDFNLLFKDVGKLCNVVKDSSEPSCFVVGAPGSFHDRLFPSNSLHLVHSSYAIHWLSQVPAGLCDEVGKPLNKGKLFASETSPPEVIKAYYSQFEQDFTSFLNCRSHEVVTNGYMVLATPCRPSITPWETRIMEFLTKALLSLASKGVIKEEKIDSLNLPQYCPCKEEIKEIVEKQGSFEIERLEVVFDERQNEVKDAKVSAEYMAKAARSITQVLISYQFGEEVWNDLYNELYQVILEELQSKGGPLNLFNIVIFLRKI